MNWNHWIELWSKQPLASSSHLALSKHGSQRTNLCMELICANNKRGLRILQIPGLFLSIWEFKTMSGAGCLQFLNLELPLNVEYLIVGYSTWKKFRSSHFVSAFISVQLILYTMDQPRLASHLWNYARCAVAEPACIASTKALYKARPPFQWASLWSAGVSFRCANEK